MKMLTTEQKLLGFCVVLIVLTVALTALLVRNELGEIQTTQDDRVIAETEQDKREFMESETSTTVPAIETRVRAVSPKETASAPRYVNRTYKRGSMVQPLQEIVDLPKTISADLDILVDRALTAAEVVPDTSTEGYRVEYFSSVNHPHHGLTEKGVNRFSSKPSAGVYFTEHCFDQHGKLVKAIGNKKDGTRYVTDTFLYEGDRPSGRLSFGPDRYSFGDHGLYKDGRLRLVARIDPVGNVKFCKCIFYAGDREDYVVRYIAKPIGTRFLVSDLHLDSIHLHDRSTLNFNRSGELTGVHYWLPHNDHFLACETLRARDANIARSGIRALFEIGGLEAYMLLHLKWIAEPNPEIRRYILEGFTEIGDLRYIVDPIFPRKWLEATSRFAPREKAARMRELMKYFPEVVVD